MSHTKTVHAFGKLTGLCTGYGGSYNPGQQNLQANALNALLLNAQQILEAMTEAQTKYANVTNHREAMFRTAGKLSTRVCSMLKASRIHPLTLEDARACCRRLNGRRVLQRDPVPPVEGQEPKNGTVYGSDYVSKLYHFARLVEIVKTSFYPVTNETMSLASLEQMLENLRAANQAVADVEVELTHLRRTRNEVLYMGQDNVVEVAQAAKQFVKAVFGYGSPQYTALTSLEFTKPRM